MRILFVFISLFFLSGLHPANVSAKDTMKKIPNGQLRVAYRQLDNGKESESVHDLILACWNNHCTITTLTLNQCFDDSFHPKIETTDTEGTLKIISITNSVLVLEEVREARLTYRFAFTTRKDTKLAKAIGLHSDIFFEDITDFSGAVVKNSVILDKVISWQLVPLKGSWIPIEAKCKIMLQGIPTK